MHWIKLAHDKKPVAIMKLSFFELTMLYTDPSALPVFLQSMLNISVAEDSLAKSQFLKFLEEKCFEIQRAIISFVSSFIVFLPVSHTTIRSALYFVPVKTFS